MSACVCSGAQAFELPEFVKQALGQEGDEPSAIQAPDAVAYMTSIDSSNVTVDIDVYKGLEVQGQAGKDGETSVGVGYEYEY